MSIQTRANERLISAGGAVSGEMEEYARQSAPWQDRTGNARRTLTGFCQHDEEKSKSLCVGVAGQMSYSPNLELGYGRRYAVLTPTTEAFAPIIMDRFRGALNDMEGVSIVESSKCKV